MPTAFAPLNTGVADPPEAASLARRILTASSALGVATALERGLGFLANFLGARLGGASTYGAYSLALTTANSIVTYAGGGIGATATRFSGDYNRSNNGYGALVRALFIVSVVSAAIATCALAFGAGPLARLMLHNPALTNLLRWSAFSAGGMVLLECARGFFVGQREFPSLMLLSLLTGAGMLVALPWAARHSAAAMVIAQAAVTISVFVVCGIAVFRKLRSEPPADISTLRVTQKIWRFGVVQLAGMAGLNIAGWWVTSLVARADLTLVQMGIFAVSSQLRNMVALAPGLLTQSSYGMLAGKERHAAPARTMTLCTFGAAVSSLGLAGLAVLMLPWALPALFGKSYGAGVLAGSFALATAVIHMSAAPAAARLTIVSLRLTGIINAAWAVLVLLLGPLLVPRGGAVAATGIYLATHLVSAVLVFAALARAEGLPAGLSGFALATGLAAATLALLAVLRQLYPEWTLPLGATIAGLVAVSIGVQGLIARRHGWFRS